MQRLNSYREKSRLSGRPGKGETESPTGVSSLNIDHIGIVVPSLEEAIERWGKVFGYTPYTQKVKNTRQKVYVVFLQKEGSLPVKLLEPVDETSPVYRFARRGGGLHHICFKCENLKKELARMEEFGLRILTPPEPGEAFANEDIAFVFAGQGLNIELIDTDKRAGVVDQETEREK